jgi:hypothetical protein
VEIIEIIGDVKGHHRAGFNLFRLQAGKIVPSRCAETALKEWWLTWRNGVSFYEQVVEVGVKILSIKGISGV